jgi:carboxymethylenebutenolidase
MNAVTAATLEADARATFAWMNKQAPCDGSRIGAIGFCLGGKAAYIANSALPLKAAASYYGGGIAPDLLPLAASQQGPILLVWGGADQHIVPAHRRAIDDALTAAKKSFTHLEFADADHAFFCDDRKAYHQPSSEEAWEITRMFFRNRMR